MGILFGNGGLIQSILEPDKWWDYFKNGRSNEVNQQLGEENLKMQQAEQDWQHAFSENERDYQRQLQQTIFDREDTAYLRQAEQLSSMGINPLSQQLNGAGAGQALSPSTPSSPVVPQNNFQMQDQGMLPVLSSMLSMADTVNGVKSGQYQRDSIALDNDRKFLENLDYANQLGINYNGLFKQNEKGYLHDLSKGYQYIFSDSDGVNLFDTDSYKSSTNSKYRKNRLDSMPSWQYTLDSFGNDDVYKQAEKALTKSAQLFDKVYDNIGEKENYSINPFRTLFNLFF